LLGGAGVWKIYLNGWDVDIDHGVLATNAVGSGCPPNGTSPEEWTIDPYYSGSSVTVS
jgi:hypothetical protein